MNPWFRFFEPQWGLWLLLLPLLAYFGYKNHQKGFLVLQRHFSPTLLAKLLPHRTHPLERFGWPVLVLALGIFALMRPQGEPTPKLAQKKGRDLVILLDLSKSMLAEDLRPNRLERAKGMIEELVLALGGERIALLGFAGEVKLLCPLTLDYTFFNSALSQANPNQIRLGGTQTGAALSQALEMLFFDPTTQGREILLITDGEDHQSDPLGAAKLAAQKGVRVHTLGLGDPKGAPIPTQDGPLTFQGQVVLTKLDEGTLREIAKLTGGYYIPAQTKQVDMAELYRKFLARDGVEKGAGEEVWVWQEWFLWFLWPMGFLLCWPVLKPLERALLRSPKVRS
ncbi:MAG: hypothetical protein A2600_13935 [Candidatus Lambdaproteobacteria bacterium RIFOXYD1_FULL_56_27]|uniref:VWFA domain-containing protein n=1 Tax=Candidatus Lambdaproteobacteria bacterium RIFOXYD2_FULL_56_26 TaxID=1817773 RepID=A0A1F6GNK1_9PROT|nr:MAG: hypothetical protein A2557_06160 [Candidatus Lambdaproteobacteria bacterium RIFOXYD2_FULL_56_26]OGG99889.1 MAG: hypothetical protein A2426_09895 [Candidatus Lambdaproteobacteria bacterium RIFOXYC1_FULL_56_13]OGH06288.1 MAG: hypothetical protein A2600_13935 [Candidatus Lambdaproteobacteria bacterium RIFOXYD1_FULL_56_27]